MLQHMKWVRVLWMYLDLMFFHSSEGDLRELEVYYMRGVQCNSKTIIYAHHFLNLGINKVTFNIIVGLFNSAENGMGLENVASKIQTHIIYMSTITHYVTATLNTRPGFSNYK